VSGNDVVARLGGDEFLVLTFENDPIAIDAIIERLSKQIQQPVGVSSGQVLEISAAIGQSSTSEPVLKLNDLLRDSDHAMYRSKRNRERTSTPAMPVLPDLPSTSNMFSKTQTTV